MAKKEFSYRGKSVEELMVLSMSEFIEMLPTRQRRTLKRGLSESQKVLLKKLSQGKKNVKTHARDMIILPEMINKSVMVYSGKEFVALEIQPEMVGHVLGEFALSRKKGSHGSPGVGATKSSSSISVR